jgi:hypothetical protein
MDGFRFNDLERMTFVGIYFSAVSCAFSEAVEDIEVTFIPEDGQAFVALLEQILVSQQSGSGQTHEGQLVHRFKNLDGDEEAAFLVCERLGGIKMTLVSGVEGTDNLSGSELGGMSVCISREDTRTLTDAFSSCTSPTN